MLNVNVFTPWQSALDWGFFNFHQSIHHITMLNFQISNSYFKVELLGLPTNNKYKCLWKPWKNPETPFLYSCKPKSLPTCIHAYLHTCILLYLHTCMLTYFHACILENKDPIGFKLFCGRLFCGTILKLFVHGRLFCGTLGGYSVATRGIYRGAFAPKKHIS